MTGLAQPDPIGAQARPRLNELHRESLRRWHELYYRSWIQGVIGQEARRYAGELALDR